MFDSESVQCTLKNTLNVIIFGLKKNVIDSFSVCVCVCVCACECVFYILH